MLPVFSQNETFTINGEVRFKGKGIILLALINESQFSEGGGKGVALFRKELTPEETTAGKCTFSFKNISEGIYGIRGFLDKNNDQKLPMGLMGPKEPWGMSWRGKKPFGYPKFKHIWFTLDKDTTIQIIFK
jgi:uncharacterized protein (DUF2141 family)